MLKADETTTTEGPMQRHVYDISHCLTQGIKVRELQKAIDPQAERRTVSYCPSPKFKSHVCYIPGRDWCPTREEAIAVACRKRERAITAAYRKIAKLQAMKFDCPDLPTTDLPC